MILDKNGNPIHPDTAERHRFGFFKIPDGARVTGFGEVDDDKRHPFVPYGSADVRREDVEAQ